MLKAKKLFCYILVLVTVIICHGTNGRNLLNYFGYGSPGKYGERLPELSIADDADTIFVVLKDLGYTTCKFYAYSKYGDRWVEEFYTALESLWIDNSEAVVFAEGISTDYNNAIHF